MRRFVICHVVPSAILVVTLLILAEGQLIGYLDATSENIKDPATVKEEWNKIENMIKNLVSKVVKRLMPILIENMEGLNISSSCIKESLQVIAGIRRLQPWAMRFLDSSAKGADGALTGTMFSLGEYDECVDTVAINRHSGKHKGEVMFTGKYCTLRIKPFLPPNPYLGMNEIIEELKEVFERDTIIRELARYASMFYYFSLRVGLCVPSGCTVDDINQVFAKVGSATSLYMRVKRCEIKEETKFTPLMIFVMCVFSFFGMAVLFSTLCDVYYYYSSEEKPDSTTARVLFAFSFMSNFRNLIDGSSQRKNLRCLNGLRFITMTWIILGHSYLSMIYQVVTGLEYVMEMVQEFAMQPIMNPTLSVETFFFIGGFLVCYNATNHVKIAKKKLNIKVYVFNRLWRILPVYISVLLSIFLLPLISTGPLAYTCIQPFVASCKQSWWSTLLFINNFYRTEDPCIPHGWYLAVDMQLYIGALIILLPLFRWPKVGVCVALVTGGGFMIASAVITCINSYPPTTLLARPNTQVIHDTVTFLYYKPYPHASSYIIGIMVGYLVAMHPQLKIPKVMQLLGWITAVLLSMSVLYGTYEWNLGRKATVLETVFYSGCHRTAWSLSIAWVVLCCTTGHGGVINYILSWSVWIPLARLNFVAYLTHVLVQTLFVGHMRSPIALTHVMGVWLFFGHLMATYGVAFAGNMLIESPFLALGKLIFSKREGRNMTTEAEKAPTQTIHCIEATKGKYTDDLCTSQICKGEDYSGFICRL